MHYLARLILKMNLRSVVSSVPSISHAALLEIVGGIIDLIYPSIDTESA